MTETAVDRALAETSPQPILRLGIDIGSTTVKAVLLDGDPPPAPAQTAQTQTAHTQTAQTHTAHTQTAHAQAQATDAVNQPSPRTLFEDYRRHHADVRIELSKLIGGIVQQFPDRTAQVTVTGSGGLGVAEALGVPFAQEVIAETEAIRQLDPDADVIIELGGEDAKITYLRPVVEQRMNGTCAGGTGAFIDQMATLLGTDAAGLDALAAGYQTLYPIASRCGVFAKTDLQPLLNDGARHEDLAASIFQAVATQTIAGLACGRPVRGRVVLLGGPLFFLPQLRAAFGRALEEAGAVLSCPPKGQLAVALGAAFLSADAAPVSLEELSRRARDIHEQGPGAAGRLRPLFQDAAEQSAFEARHARTRVPRIPIEEARGACFLGIDAGSTTIKAVLIDSEGRICHTHYAPNQGSIVAAAAQIVNQARRALPGPAIIARACVTGYGEGLVRTALHVDDGEVETMAHYRAAEFLQPQVTSVIDIGGQDMKYLRIVDGAIDEIRVNEACSSGCGSFLQTFAQTLSLDVEAFCRAAVASFAPVDLGSRCTVFMNSSVKAAQKDGASVGDIAAGLSYSVIRNALYKVIKLRDSGQLGAHVVVQGGTFLSDAVLRAFELLTGLEVVRPDIAGLMGAFGAALIARSRFAPGAPSRLLAPLALRSLKVETRTETCRLCQNHCQCTISEFPDGSQHVSGNRCERAGDRNRAKSDLPNLFDFKYKRLFAYRRLTDKAATRGSIGIPRVLNMYENYPLWFTVLTKLGFRVVLSGRSNHDLFVAGMDSIASENICYPAKLVHGHIEQLVERGVKTIFYPSVSYERELAEGADNHFNCPVVTSYPQVIANNVESLRDGGVRLINPFFNLALPDKLAERLVEELADWSVTLEEAQAAVAAGYAEQAAFTAEVQAEGLAALEFMERTGVKGIVLAGRPYHVDPEIHHGIPELITSLGMAVLTEDSICQLGAVERPLRARDQWAYHSRLYQAAAAVRPRPELELVQLNSFGCGLDAITSDQVQEILHSAGRVHTLLKIDEVSNLGAARIRLRSLAAAALARADRKADGPPANGAVDAGTGGYGAKRRLFTKKMKTEHTIIAPQMSPVHFSLLEAAFRGSGYGVRILPTVSPDDVETGLRHVNNDSCYPAIMVVGQLVAEFTSGRAEPADTSVLITQTGGMCRATNYVGLLRKALAEAGYPQVAVIAMSTQGLEKNPGFKLSLGLMDRCMRAIVIGDLLEAALLRTRPYEAVPGSAMALYRKFDAAARRLLGDRRTEAVGPAGAESSPTPTRTATPARGRRALGLTRAIIGYPALVRRIVREFDALPVVTGQRRLRVGIVGEILVKFHPDANNHVVDVVESEGFEARLPGLMEFVLNGMHTVEWNYRTLGTGRKTLRLKQFVRWLLERYRDPVRRALARARTDFPAPGDLTAMARQASDICSLGNQAGEGWLLTAEILELIESGVRSIICAQPFACLPNHVTGKGMFREIMRRHPGVNIVTIEYDPGASPVNQLNRIKLLLASAKLAAPGAGVGGAGVGATAAQAAGAGAAARNDWPSDLPPGLPAQPRSQVPAGGLAGL
ncbi:MAG: acyl-CoA dehydratase activase-related protein [Bifidobacteriaceae bacterium]|jgi:predicted CoA-substrate-specific enzyme activase|nr:acyl-CoA dehydratase activase-related protein [Bifidobacteriaceae bacterium]